MGCEFGLLAQELRSQFTSAIIFTSQKLMHKLSIECHANLTSLLFQIDHAFPQGHQTRTDTKKHLTAGASVSEIQEYASAHFDCIHKGLLDIQPHLEDWVFISLSRGLWDNISRDMFLFTVDLKEDEHNKVIAVSQSRDVSLSLQAWRRRMHCSEMANACDMFFKNLLTDLFPHRLNASDTIPPMHARKLHEMLDKNTKLLNNAFSVY